MEVENPRIGNGDDGDIKRSNGDGGGLGRLYGWPASRIVRVSRASGGKDRHSKVWTSKGLRDRRVRLSVNTAVQFYDLQDRLGYDQPSKAVEWLLKAAAPFIDELPSLNASFPDTLQLTDERRPRGGGGGGGEQQHSSPSDTSKGTGGLSLSRSEYRVLALERARERAAGKEKSKENANPLSQNTSFTELLTSGGAGGNNVKGESDFFSVDYVTNGLLTRSAVRSPSGDYPAHQIHLGNPMMTPPASSPLFSQQFSFVADHNHQQQHDDPNNYNLNFSISSSSSGLAAFRGTLQSNSSSSSPSPSLLPPHLQRFHPIDGAPTSFFTSSNSHVDNHHHFLHGFDARLQLHYGDPQTDLKPKGKN
ncbi:unnamed protein product [Cuscuta epithymum]|uniref:TCP domain-containing protein n=1 Tax=Cuscuta epithymum TaxID=186058 RepID=A0AAV0E118_9ASTE|nr:unnamed protein product [Cuscuta epithymum]